MIVWPIMTFTDEVELAKRSTSDKAEMRECIDQIGVAGSRVPCLKGGAKELRISRLKTRQPIEYS